MGYLVRKMKWKDEDLPALREIESAVLQLWRGNPDMNNYDVRRAYEAAYRAARREARGQEPEDHGLSGVEADLYAAIRQACEKLLTVGPEPMKGLPEGNTAPVERDQLSTYLRELGRSVERHTREGGRQGYLNFLRQFLR